MFEKNYQARKNDKIEQGQVRFAQFFGIYFDKGVKPSLTNKDILVCNLLYSYHLNDLEDPFFYTLIQAIHSANDINGTNDKDSFFTFLDNNPRVRRYLMLFNQECSKPLRKTILAYELNQRLKEAGTEKKAIIQKYINQEDLTVQEKEKLMSARTGEVLRHFNINLNVIGKNETNSMKNTLSVANREIEMNDRNSSSPQSSLESLEVILVPTPKEKISYFNALITNLLQQSLLQDNNENKKKFFRLCGLAALGVTMSARGFWFDVKQALFSSPHQNRRLYLSEEAARNCILNYLIEQNFSKVTFPKNSPSNDSYSFFFIQALSKGSLGDITKKYLPSFEKIAENSPNFKKRLHNAEIYKNAMLESDRSTYCPTLIMR